MSLETHEYGGFVVEPIIDDEVDYLVMSCVRIRHLPLGAPTWKVEIKHYQQANIQFRVFCHLEQLRQPC